MENIRFVHRHEGCDRASLRLLLRRLERLNPRNLFTNVILQILLQSRPVTKLEENLKMHEEGRECKSWTK
jgi:hypothetical protein